MYKEDDVVIFQEATRPMVSVDMISKLLQACYENGSANICQGMRDYVQFTYLGGKVNYIDRDSIVSLESPEAYRVNIISEVFSVAEKKQHPLNESCCAMLLFNLGYDINFIEGSVNNIKIVRQEDVGNGGTWVQVAPYYNSGGTWVQVYLDATTFPGGADPQCHGGHLHHILLHLLRRHIHWIGHLLGHAECTLHRHSFSLLHDGGSK